MRLCLTCIPKKKKCFFSHSKYQNPEKTGFTATKWLRNLKENGDHKNVHYLLVSHALAKTMKWLNVRQKNLLF